MIVIPGRPEGEPEPDWVKHHVPGEERLTQSWVPGSSLREAPE